MATTKTKKKKKSKKGAYDASTVQALDDIEHIRLRPAMYIGDDGEDGFYHIAKEVIDNSLDECLTGNADYISIVLDDDKKGMTVSDNGRGIPHEKNKKTKLSTLATVFCVARSGAKFDGKTYSTSAGLHGVGATATNALSEVFEAWSYRGGKEAYVKFNYGKLPEKMKDAEITKADKDAGTGTVIHFRPDPQVFRGISGYKPSVLKGRMQEVSYLAPGITIAFADKEDGKEVEYHSSEGLFGLLKSRLPKKMKFEVDPFEASVKIPVEVYSGNEVVMSKASADVAVSWTGNMNELADWYTFTNLTPNPQGGTHLSGLERAMGEMLVGLAKGKCTASELFRGMKASIHIRHPDPKFKNQTKDKLVNQDVIEALKEALQPLFKKWMKKNKEWLTEHVEQAITVYNESVMSKDLRNAMRDMKKVTRNSKGLLPGKLYEADCSPDVRETFIVEGDSAGGSCVSARDASYQEVLALRGKVLNTMRADLAKALSNKEIKDIVTTIGAGVGPQFDLKKCRLNKVILLADADPDGGHITALLVAFFLQHMPALVEDGRLYIVDSPLFQGSIPSSRKRYYGHSLEDLKTKAGADFARCKVSRLKGHGEASAEAVGEYAMEPNSRRLIRVTTDTSTLAQVTALMADDVAARKRMLGLR